MTPDALKATCSTCRGCGRKVLFVLTSDGKRMCLDAVAPCYVVDEVTLDGRKQYRCDRAPLAFVSHFVTCPNRDQFRKGAT